MSDAPRMSAIAALEGRIGHAFANRGLIEEALTHASLAEGRPGMLNNERLEFLGDRVLGLVIAERLYACFPGVGENGLAPRLNALVNRGACARAARRCGLPEAITMARSEAQAGGRDKDTILADACEALIAALYLDAGLPAAARFVERFWEAEFVAIAEAPREPKTHLQEWAAQTGRGVPLYVVRERGGPDHAPYFVVEASVAGVSALGRGGAKRDAEREAAAALLREFGLVG